MTGTEISLVRYEVYGAVEIVVSGFGFVKRSTERFPMVKATRNQAWIPPYRKRPPRTI